MAVRDMINQHRWIGFAIAILGPAIAIGSLWHDKAVERREIESRTLAWYSDDEGQTWFSQDFRMTRPPFNHDGKTAYRAYVFTTDGGKTCFVGYLRRYTPHALQMLLWAQQMAASGPPPAGVNESISRSGVEVKKPGGNDWINVADPRAKSIRQITGPGGAPAQPVLP